MPAPALPAAPANLTVVTRCTLTLSDELPAPARLAALAAQYSLVALRPTTAPQLQQACTLLACDIISLDFSARLPFALKHRTVGAALLRNIVFEICYAPAIDSTAARRNLLQNAAALVRATRGGRGIVVSSEARQALTLRAPNDVMNLAVMWGLGPEKAKDAVSGSARATVRQAEERRRVTAAAAEGDSGARDERKRKPETQGGGMGKKGKQVV